MGVLGERLLYFEVLCLKNREGEHSKKKREWKQGKGKEKGRKESRKERERRKQGKKK